MLNEKVVGYALLTTGGGNMAIDRSGVLQEHRRKRVGTKLIAMAILESQARNLEFMVTVLRESNVAAQHFVYACGFRAGKMAGPLKGWFGNEGGIGMRRLVIMLALPDG